jgi:hypothetical protein
MKSLIEKEILFESVGLAPDGEAPPTFFNPTYISMPTFKPTYKYLNYQLSTN